MPVRLNIKKHDGRFADAPKEWSASVSGADVLWAKGLEAFLQLHGFTPFKHEDGFKTWTLKKSHNEPPVYLAPILRRKFEVEASREVREILDNAVKGRPPEDGLERFLGQPKTVDGGRLPLTVVAGSRDFLANCDADDWDRRLLLAGAGWLPVTTVTPALAQKFGSMPFRTSDAFLAANLVDFMAKPAAEKLAKATSAAMKHLKDSRSQEAPEDFRVPVPEGIDYLDFQKGGIAKVLEVRKSSIIADEMGLGKTVQGIGIYNGMCQDDPEMGDVLVLCQANMKIKWCREFEKWGVKEGMTTGWAEGSNVPDTDILAVNYDIAERNIEKLRARKWKLILTDEAHNLRNEETKRSQAILGDLTDLDGPKGLPLAPGGIMVHLTGTPRPRGIENLWPLLTSSRPDIWGRGEAAKRAFINRYQPPTLIQKMMQGRGGREYPKVLALPGKPVREHELQMRMRGSGSFIRRLKRDTDLPPKFRTPIEMPVRLSKEQQEALAQIDAEIEAILNDAVRRGDLVMPGERRAAGNIIDVVSGVPAYLAQFHENSRLRRNLGLLKAPLCGDFIAKELLEDSDLEAKDRRKTVVFAHHKEVIDILAERIEQDFPGGVLRYDGSIASDKKRQKIIDQFQEDEAKRCIIISLSGATGITLTAAARMRVVEMDWLPSNMIQIEDRIWRIGQTQNVDIGYLFIPNSMDVKLGNGIIERMVSEEASLNTFRAVGKGKAKAGGLLERPALSDAPATTKTPRTPAKTAAPAAAEAAPQLDLFA